MIKKIAGKETESILALTPMQEGLLFHYLKDRQGEFYFNQTHLEISGEIDPTCFEKSWNLVITANEILRTVFRWEKLEKPIQVVLKKHPLHLKYHDLSTLEDSEEQNRQWKTIKQQDRSHQFDLRRVPFRVTWCKMGPMHHHILISNHHILYDGWSTGIILKEFFRAYDVLAAGGQPPLSPVKPGFKQFIRWHGRQDREEQKKFWQNYLAGIETPTRLPLKQLKQSPENPGERNYRLHLQKTVKDRLELFVKERRLSLAAVFYSAWGLLLQKYCCMEDVVFGTIVSGRSAPIREIENMVGLFINTIPHRAGLEPGETLLDFMNRINKRLAALGKYENTPLVDIYSYSQSPNQVGEELFDTIVAVENYPLDTYLSEMGPQLCIRSHSMDERPHYDLTLVIAAGEGIDINFIYNNRLLEKETVVRLAGHFRTILQGIEENAHTCVCKVEMLSTEEKHQLIKNFNSTYTAFTGEKTIQQLFEKQVERTPDNIAVIGPLEMKYRTHMTHVSYLELNERVGQLAYTLIEKNVQADTVVGIMVERSIEMVTGILGILKAGGAYIPIDPAYPPERIDFMLKDSGFEILLKGIDITAPAFNNHPKGTSSHLHLPPAPATSLAYVIYTSGSMGKPKGVMVQHGSVVNLLWAMQCRYPLGERDTYLLKTSYLFDVSVTELFGWFLEGGRLVVLETGGEKDPKAILEMIAREGVTHVNFVPSMFHMFVEILDSGEIAQLAGLKYIFLAGEALLPGPVNRFRRLNLAIAIENIYGPTEAAVYASWYSLADWKGEASIPIGKPLPNMALYIVDKWGYFQPIGVPGELCIGGGGLARGYLNNPALTAEKFDHDLWDYHDYHDEEINQKFLRGVQGGSCYKKRPPGRRRHPSARGPYMRTYKTGDLARWLPDSNIEFLGRMDFQVKVRGFRIELGEIENRLIGHESVKEAVVSAIVDKTGGNALCAYLVLCLPGDLAIDPIRNYLRQKLPDYMIPGYFVILKQIPLTGSGKVDRKTLPEPGAISTRPYAAPASEIEVGLVSIWAEVLGLARKQIGIDDNFFELGGHSLKATTLVSKIHKKLKFRFPLQQVFEMSTIRTQAAYMAKPGDCPYDSIKPVEEMEYYDLSYAQRRLWVLCQFEEDSAAYNMPRAEAISGRFDINAFIKAVHALAHRHESLRTIFIQVDGTPRQKPIKDFTFNLETIDLRELEQEEKEKKAREIYRQDANRAFDLRHGPLFRFTLVQIQDTEYVLIFNIHHIINDGWSQGIIHNEIIRLYNKNPLPPLQLQYRDYTRWHNRCIDTGYFQVPGQYWLEKFKDKPNGIQLPQDHPRRPIQTFNGGRVTCAISKETTRQLHRISREQDATLFMSLLTLLDIFLYKYSGQTDIIVGAPIAGRRHAELHPLVGFLVNTLVYRAQVNPDNSFKQYLAAIKDEALNCYRNQDYPFDLMVEELELDRVLTQSPLFNVMLAHNNAETRDNSLMMVGAKMSRYVHADDYNMSKFDLIFFMDEIHDQVWLQLEFNSDLFEHQTIERMAANFLTLMERVTSEVNAPISTMSCLSEPEYQQVIHEFNTTASPFPPVTLQELFEKQVMRSKDKTALVYNEEHISYEALNSQINQYAHYLRKEHGVSPNDVIGISMERSIRMIALLLGIIKSGAAYLAVDPTYPRERILHVLADSQAEVLVTDKIRPEFFADYPGKIIEINAQKDETIPMCSQNSVIHNQPSDILYVNYTSGSTGSPNGAMLSHGLLSNLIQWQSQKSLIDCSLRCLQFTTINFCVSFQEILGTLTSGGELHLIGEMERQDIDYLVDFLSRHRIENLFLPFSYLNFLFTETGRWHESFRHHLKHMITAGEQLKITPGLEAFLNRNPRVKLHNHYGSTEMHVVTSYTLDAASAAQTPIPPSGKPISNTRIYILDEHFNPVPVGVWGELFVAGACEFLGYINNSALTAKKLIHHSHLPPDEQKMRLYRTGDMGRWLENGNIEFKGRKDLMVKIRGFRVELGEIETQLLAHHKVKEAAVIVGDGSGKDKFLCAYIVAKWQETGKLDPLELREYLANRLPDYMIPSYFVQLNRIPLTPNGKVDKEALPAPGIKEEKDYAPPRDNTEKKLQDIWSGVLGIEKEKIGIHDNFFHLGGHSLKATVLVSRIYKELAVKVPLTEIFITPSIQALAAFVKNARKQEFFSIRSMEKREYYKLSSAQRRLFILQRMDEQGTGYNMPAVWQVQGNLEVKKLETIFQRSIRRHLSLRTSFIMVNDEPVQRIKQENYKIQITNYKQSTCLKKRQVPYDKSQITNKEESFGQELNAAGEIIQAETGEPSDNHLSSVVCGLLSEFVRPFDLSQAPLLRVGLIEICGQKHILVVDMHHIVSDGISGGILLKEFMELYAGMNLSVIRLQYKDFSHWQNSGAQGELIKRQETYWLKQFKGDLPVLNLPADYHRPPVQSFAGGTIHFEISKEETAAIKSLARHRDVTLFMLLISIFTVFLCKISDQEDIVVGTPVAGRGHSDLQGIIGMFVNTLALRNFPVMEKTFGQFLEEIKENTIKAFENQDYLYEDLVEQMEVERDTGRNPLFDTVFTLQNVETPALQIPGLKIAPYHCDRRIAKFDLTLTAEETGECLAFAIEYCTRLFKKETIWRFAGFFKKTVSFLLENHETVISAVEIITKEEKRKILHDLSENGVEYPQHKTIQRLYAEQVEKTPDHTALLGPGHGTRECSNRSAKSYMSYISITYRELAQKTHQLAGKLKEKGIGPDKIVGLKVERSLEMIIGMLGILKAGGAYLPIDPGNPPERIDYILKDSGAKILLTEQEIAGLYSPPAFKICPKDTPSHLHQSPAPATSLAYVIYTSGSTGKPKGVLITQRNICPLLHWGFHHYGIGVKARTLQNLSYFFDWSAWEIFITLTSGGGLYIAPSAVIINAEATMEFIKTHAVTVLHVTPTQFQYLLNAPGDLKTLDYLFIGAEKLTVNVVQRGYDLVRAECRVFNMYGPTEAAIISAALEIRRGDEIRYKELSSVPIGRPSDNTYLLVVDKSFNICPVRAAGELYIGGDGVSRGYLNNPELTAEKFDRDKWDYHDYHDGNHRSYKSYPSYIHYKTGDQVRWLEEGNIEFLGRMDHQVKIRGYRIELGEIQQRLQAHEKIKEAVVIPREDNNDKYLCAYILAKPGKTTSLDGTRLRKYLSNHLPDYMIPAYFVQLENIPLNPNGKVDIKALPPPALKTGEDYIAPRDEIEKKLQDVWSEILGVEKEKIGMNDNFFHIGGHSLKAAVLAARIHKELNINVSLTRIFEAPTIRELAKCINGLIKDQYESIKSVEKKDYYQVSSTQKRLFILQQMESGHTTSYNMPYVIPLEKEIDKEKLASAFAKLIGRHESLRTSFLLLSGEPVQRIHDSVKFAIHDFGLEKESKKVEEIIANFERPFDLSRAPLLRVGLIKLPHTTTVIRGSFSSPAPDGQQREEPGSKYILLVDMHHIITDGASQNILEREFWTLVAGKELNPLRLHYKDFSGWQNSRVKEELLQQQETFWREELSHDDQLPVLNLPTDHPRPLVQSFEGSSVHFVFTPQETRALRDMAKEIDATLFMCLLSIYTILLAKLSGHEDIIVGIPIAARRHADMEHIIGMFANTLAMRNYPSGEKTFKAFFLEVKERTLKAFENQEYPFEELVEKVPLQRDISRNPIFDIMFNLLNRSELNDAVEMPLRDGEAGHRYAHRKRTAKFDLNLTAIDNNGERLYFDLEYCTRLFKAGTIERIIGYFRRIVALLSVNIGLKISGLEIITEEEKARILEMSNGVEDASDIDQTIHGWYEDQVVKSPDSIALVGMSHRAQPGAPRLAVCSAISFRELNEKSNQLARVLIEKGVTVDTVVGLMVERSIEMIAAILAILKAGGAYLPIDKEYPGARKSSMLKDSRVKLFLTSHHWESLPGTPTNEIEILDIGDKGIYSRDSRNPSLVCTGANLLYVIYTSGSTGQPKGVILEHRSLVNLVNYQYKYTHIDFSRVLQFTTISFDVSAQEIFSTLLAGGRLSVIDKETRNDVTEMFQVVKRDDIKTLFLATAFLKFIFKEKDDVGLIPAGVRHIAAAGEQLIISDNLKKYLKKNHVYLHNHYGPSETHVVTALTLDPAGEIPDLPSIGQPILNTSIFILDKNHYLLPLGVSGELYIGGAGLSRGYLNNPELTAEKFDHDLWNYRDYHDKYYRSYTSYILYKTGDLARWLPCENIEFLGRIDRQVKIRGFRVEPGEIESRLLEYAGVKEAAVRVRTRRDDANDKYLCAYIVAAGKISPMELRGYLLKDLPGYMIPDYFIFLDEMPLTPNGKIDGKALPGPDGKGTGQDYHPPRNGVEEKLVGIWSEVLAVEKEKISIDTDFFQLGGHSLKMTLLAAKIHQRLGVKLTMGELFRKSTIMDMAAALKGVKTSRFIHLEPIEKKEYYELSHNQRRLWLTQQFEPGNTAYNMPACLMLEHGVREPWLEKVIHEMARRHESLRTGFKEVKNRPVQFVVHHVDIPLKKIDISSLTGEEKQRRAGEIFLQEAQAPFDLSRAPLFRALLVKLDRENFQLIFNMHHIISDGQSMEILKKEFLYLYNGRGKGETRELERIKCQYKDFAQWQGKQSGDPGPKHQAHEFWKKTLAKEMPELKLPFDIDIPRGQNTGEGAAYTLSLPGETKNRLKRLAETNATSLFVVMLSLYYYLLRLISGQGEIRVGLPVWGRDHAALQDIVGFIVNTVIMDAQVEEEIPYIEFLGEVDAHVMEILHHQSYPLELVLNNMNLQFPRVNVFFNMLNLGTGPMEEKLPPVSSHRTQGDIDVKFDMMLYITEFKKCIQIDCRYNKALFRASTVASLMGKYAKIIDFFTARPEKCMRHFKRAQRIGKKQLLKRN